MSSNYRVEVKNSASSPWRFTGIIEGNKDTADRVWSEIIKNLQYHDYRLIPITYGSPATML